MYSLCVHVFNVYHGHHIPFCSISGDKVLPGTSPRALPPGPSTWGRAVSARRRGILSHPDKLRSCHMFFFSQQSHPEGLLCWSKIGIPQESPYLDEKWRLSGLPSANVLAKYMWHKSFRKMNDIPSLSLYHQWVARPGSSKWRNDPPHTARKWVQESLSHRGSIQVEMHMPRASLSKVQKEEVNAMMPTIREKGPPIHPLDEKIKERESESLQREV